MRHENINGFVGCYIDIKQPALIFEYANRGSLQVSGTQGGDFKDEQTLKRKFDRFSKDIIMKKDIKLDWNFKWSMLNDLCRVSWFQQSCNLQKKRERRTNFDWLPFFTGNALLASLASQVPWQLEITQLRRRQQMGAQGHRLWFANHLHQPERQPQSWHIR